MIVEEGTSETAFVSMAVAAPNGDIATVLKTIASMVKYVAL